MSRYPVIVTATPARATETTWIEVTPGTRLRARTRTGGGRTVAHLLHRADALGALGMVAVEDAEPGSTGVRWSPPGLELVTLVLHGAYSHADSGGGRALIGSEDIAVLATSNGVHREESVQSDGLRAVLIWMFTPARAARSAFAHRTIPRHARVGGLVPVACSRERGSLFVMQLASDVTVATGVLSVGTSATAHAQRGRGYVMSTLGAITVDGVLAEPGDRVILRGTTPVRVHALESTEVVFVDA